MDSSIVKTEAEIDQQLEWGKDFITKYPRSFFGDDNVKNYRLTERILNKAKEGASISELEDMVELLEEGQYLTASDTVLWLTGDEDYDIYSDPEE